MASAGIVGERAGHDSQAVGTGERATPLAPRQVGVVLVAQRALSERPQRKEVQTAATTVALAGERLVS